MQSVDQQLIIFTDGASRGNPGPGGYGAVVVFEALDEVIELGGSKPVTTNNEMELMAVISALVYVVHNTAPAHIYTDSSYVVNGITQWVHRWEKNGWQTKEKQPVANQKNWQQLLDLVREREKKSVVTWHTIPGHSGVMGNERADAIATAFADGKQEVLYRGKLSQYPQEILDLSVNPSMVEKKATRKNTGKAHSYLSLVDGVVMRHDTWTETEARVKGISAKYRKALSAEHEKEILKEWNISDASL